MDLFSIVFLAIFVVSALLVGRSLGTGQVIRVRDKGLLVILVVSIVALVLKLVYGL